MLRRTPEVEAGESEVQSQAQVHSHPDAILSNIILRLWEQGEKSRGLGLNFDSTFTGVASLFMSFPCM